MSIKKAHHFNNEMKGRKIRGSTFVYKLLTQFALERQGRKTINARKRKHLLIFDVSFQGV